MKTHLLLIIAKTNLLVGNESSVGTGIIDKAVQRDVLTGLPCINSSSLKGAVNEFCTFKGMSSDDRLRVFGSDKAGVKPDSQKGSAIFYDAKLLYCPKQGDNTPYTLVTNDDVVKDALDRAALLNIDGVSEKVLEAKTACRYGVCKLQSFSDFKELTDNEHLPVIARNKLDHGASENLWYEQVVPAETVFCVMIQDIDDKLVDFIEENGGLVQIGANATIGYGVCKFVKVI